MVPNIHAFKKPIAYQSLETHVAPINMANQFEKSSLSTVALFLIMPQLDGKLLLKDQRSPIMIEAWHTISIARVEMQIVPFTVQFRG